MAAATPCWPAPVSAIIRCLPIRTVSSAWPTTLLSLCEPVWARSSRLAAPARRGARRAGGTRSPASAGRRSRAGPRRARSRNAGSAQASAKAASSSRQAGHERLGDEAPAELAEAAVGARVPHQARRRRCGPSGRSGRLTRPSSRRGRPSDRRPRRLGRTGRSASAASAAAAGRPATKSRQQLGVLAARRRPRPRWPRRPRRGGGGRWPGRRCPACRPPETISRRGVDHPLGQPPVEDLARARARRRRSAGSRRRTRRSARSCGRRRGNALMVQRHPLARPTGCPRPSRGRAAGPRRARSVLAISTTRLGASSRNTPTVRTPWGSRLTMSADRGRRAPGGARGRR